MRMILTFCMYWQNRPSSHFKLCGEFYENLKSKPTTRFLLQFSHPWDFWSMNFTLYPPSHHRTLQTEHDYITVLVKQETQIVLVRTQKNIRWELSNPENLRILPKTSFFYHTLSLVQYMTRWWFQRFCMFTLIWGRFPFWLIFFKGVETTN